jgi:hypothetical protein
VSRRYGVPCPANSEHGTLLDWPGERTGFFCPHQDHGGNGAFFTTDLAPALSRSRTDSLSHSQTTGGVRSSIRRPDATPPVAPDRLLTLHP